MTTPTFRFDLHSHSLFSDGTGTPEQIAKAASAAKLDLLAITDHHANKGVGAKAHGSQPESVLHETAAALLQHGVQPIIGCEYSTAQGHLLVYGIDIHVGSWGEYPQMQDVIDDVNRMGGACIVPHAFHGYTKCLKSDLLKIRDLAAVEGWNGRVEARNPGTNLLAREAAGHMGALMVASSDAHSPQELGRSYTLFPEMVRSGTELAQALRKGGFQPVCDVEAYAKSRIVSEASLTSAVSYSKYGQESFDDWKARTKAPTVNTSESLMRLVLRTMKDYSMGSLWNPQSIFDVIDGQTLEDYTTLEVELALTSLVRKGLVLEQHEVGAEEGYFVLNPNPPAKKATAKKPVRHLPEYTTKPDRDENPWLPDSWRLSK